VVAVLSAPCGVPPDGLDVTVRRRADPDIRPGRRNRDRSDAPQRRRVAQLPPRGRLVGETSTDLATADAGVTGVDISEAARPRVPTSRSNSRRRRRPIGQERSRRRAPAAFLPEPLLHVRVKMLIFLVGRFATGGGAGRGGVAGAGAGAGAGTGSGSSALGPGPTATGERDGDSGTAPAGGVAAT